MGVCVVGRPRAQRAAVGQPRRDRGQPVRASAEPPHTEGSISSPEGETPISLALSGHRVSCGGREVVLEEGLLLPSVRAA